MRTPDLIDGLEVQLDGDLVATLETDGAWLVSRDGKPLYGYNLSDTDIMSLDYAVADAIVDGAA